MAKNNRPPAPLLGLVCLSAGDELRFRTVTRTHLHKHTAKEQEALLRALYRDNLERLARAPAFCAALPVSLYRMPSGLFPFADGGPGAPLLEELRDELAALGRRATAQGLRLVMHPDQYVVLSSDSPATVENARVLLEAHGRLLDLLEQPRSPWAALIVHGGKGDRAEALVREVRRLPEAARSRLCLENDERAYSSAEIHAICRAAGVPMIFDAHHHIIHERLGSYDDPDVGRWLAAARGTWPDPAWQLVHISNGREHLLDMRHSDFIRQMPACYRDAPWIEIEAKAKDQAIRDLRTRWPGAS
jgi:UV DNA damage endonuclease